MRIFGFGDEESLRWLRRIWYNSRREQKLGGYPPKNWRVDDCQARRIGQQARSADEERVYIQSAYSMETEEKRNQETLPLRKTGDSFRKIVVRGDYQDAWMDESGVVHVGIIPFLLDKSLVEASRVSV